MMLVLMACSPGTVSLAVCDQAVRSYVEKCNKQTQSAQPADTVISLMIAEIVKQFKF